MMVWVRWGWLLWIKGGGCCEWLLWGFVMRLGVGFEERMPNCFPNNIPTKHLSFHIVVLE